MTIQATAGNGRNPSRTARSSSARRGANGLGRTQTRIAGKFRTEYNKTRLYDVVRKAALHANPDAPKQLPQTRFDSVRADIGHPDCPSARQIAIRINRPWRDIVNDAVDDNANQVQRDAVREAKSKVVDEDNGDSSWLTVEHLHYAVRKVARHLGIEAPSAARYQAARIELLAADRKRHSFGGILEETLPTVGQLEVIAAKEIEGDQPPWDKVLLVAGVSVSPVGGTGGGAARLTREAVEMPVAVRFYMLATDGMLPRSEHELYRFAEAANLAMNRRGKVSFGEIRQAGVKLAAEHGEHTTGELPPSRTKPAFDLSTLDGFDLPQRVRRVTEESVINALVEYLDVCEQQNVEPRSKHYVGLSSRHRWPSKSHFPSGKTWGAWITLAEEERRARARLKAA